MTLDERHDQYDVPEEDAGGVSLVEIERLVRGPMVRVEGENHAHARLLAWTPQPLPPILVHRSTMMVIDGMHRLLAAQIRGDTTIAVRFFEGGDDEAFVVAVKANIAHGMPLSLADRELAAQKIIVLHPEWSDRVIGETCAVSPKTVAGIRRCTTGEGPQLPVRRGRDGRSRPVDPIPGRLRIAAALVDDPGASLRRIAALTGTSVNTVRDVRRRVAEHKSPIPDHLLGATPDRRDRFDRWFGATHVSTDDCAPFVDVVPLDHLNEIIAEARARARVWAQFAADLSTRGGYMA